ncbi:hypothetical protein FCV25MIE_07825 [Fagus crenata]
MRKRSKKKSSGSWRAKRARHSAFYITTTIVATGLFSVLEAAPAMPGQSIWISPSIISAFSLMRTALQKASVLDISRESGFR